MPAAGGKHGQTPPAALYYTQGWRLEIGRGMNSGNINLFAKKNTVNRRGLSLSKAGLRQAQASAGKV